MTGGHFQRGVTLINLMIGMTISMIASVAMMLMFTHVVSTTSVARESASAEARYLSSTLTASAALQEAGFGISGAQLGTHLVIISGAIMTDTALSGTVVAGVNKTGNAVIWELRLGVAVQCAGLYAPPLGGLQSLPNVACSSAGPWSISAATPIILVPSPPAGSDTVKLDRFVPVIFSINARTQLCKPYGVTDANGNVQVSLTANYSKGERMSLSTEQCLVNFPAP